MARRNVSAGEEKRKAKAKDCAHLETGLRYLFTPQMGQRVIAITYCKNCGKELSRESVSVNQQKRED
jgi:hypothetical protein